MTSTPDLVIRGGNIADGKGGDLYEADVAISGGRITEVGKVAAKGKEEIDAKGKLVAPGFVDVHTHYDGQVTWSQDITPSSQNGVTTAIMGNCGVGFAPCRPSDHVRLIQLMEGVEDIPGPVLSAGIPWAWESFPDYMEWLSKRSFDVDIGAQLPHAALRVYVMGERPGGTGQGSHGVEDRRVQRDFARRPGILHHNVVARNVHARHCQRQQGEHAVKQKWGRCQQGQSRRQHAAETRRQKHPFVACPVTPCPPSQTPERPGQHQRRRIARDSLRPGAQMVLGIQYIKRHGKTRQSKGHLPVQKAPEMRVGAPDPQAVLPVMACMRVIVGRRQSGRLPHKAQRQDADGHNQKRQQKTRAVAVRKAAVRSRKQAAEDGIHPDPQHSRHPARIAEQPPAPRRRYAFPYHHPVRGLIDPHGARVNRNNGEQSPDQPAGMRSAPQHGQGNQRQQRKSLNQGHGEQIRAGVSQAAEIAHDQQTGQKHQQIIQGGQRPDCRVACPQMMQKQGQNRRVGDQGRAERPADGVNQAGGEIEPLVGSGWQRQGWGHEIVSLLAAGRGFQRTH